MITIYFILQIFLNNRFVTFYRDFIIYIDKRILLGIKRQFSFHIQFRFIFIDFQNFNIVLNGYKNFTRIRLRKMILYVF